jgi:hypothetical protein
VFRCRCWPNQPMAKARGGIVRLASLTKLAEARLASHAANKANANANALRHYLAAPIGTTDERLRHWLFSRWRYCSFLRRWCCCSRRHAGSSESHHDRETHTQLPGNHRISYDTNNCRRG